jgi:CheY-like chemotaxis protein
MGPFQPYFPIIDDEPSLREALHELLSGEGFRVSVHGTWVDDLVERAPDLILLDVMTPGECTGIEFIRRLKAEFIRRLKADVRTARIPTCVCTGAARFITEITDALTEQDCRPIGKSLEVEDLLGEINRCVEHVRAAPAVASPLP